MIFLTTIAWNEIDNTDVYLRHQHIDDIQVLVYDAELDDVVLAHLVVDVDGEVKWIEQMTVEPLPAPKFWAYVPYPFDRNNNKFPAGQHREADR